MPERLTYRLSGHFFELCDCSSICPCWLGDEPNDGRCTGVFAWSITSGVIDGVDVTGCKVVSASFHTGNRRDGGQDVFLFVDEGCTDRQAEALADAYTGKLGGPLGELATLLGELRGTAKAPIELINNDRTTTLSVGRSIGGTAEVLFGTDGQVTELAHSPVSDVLAARAEVGRTADFRVNLGATGFDLEVTGRAAMRGRFTYRCN
jgi:hypothetical protein